MRGSLIVVFSSGLLAGCFSPPPVPICRVLCEGSECPPGSTCGEDDFCHPPGHTALCPPVAPAASRIVLGARHTCMLNSDDTLWCWGANDKGQLGSPAGLRTNVPLQVDTQDVSEWELVAAGAEHTCAIASAEGSLWCWGKDEDGQLGDGTPGVYRQLPAPVEGGPTERWSGAAAGGYHTCGISAGSMWCWGFDYSGQLGDGPNAADKPNPTPVAGGFTDWLSVTAGDVHTCGIRVGGRLYCWGGGDHGQLGLDDIEPRDAPTPVPGPGGRTWLQVSAGMEHTCAILDDQTLWCWGDNGQGETGQPLTVGLYDIPTLVDDTYQWVRVVAGRAHSCGQTDDDRIFCWGFDEWGALGDGPVQSSDPILRQVDPASSWTLVATGAASQHTCGRKSDGSYWCWGDDGDGQLGDAVFVDKHSPERIGSQVWNEVSTTREHTCGVRTDGTLWCWGQNSWGQIGIGSEGHQNAPRAVTATGVSGWSHVSAGGGHTCAIDDTGDVWCWGAGESGQLGGGMTTGTQVPARSSTPGEDWKDIACGRVHSCGIKLVMPGDTTGEVLCWGSNSYLQLGTPSAGAMQEWGWQSVSGNGWASVDAGCDTSCALGSGDLYCWGWNMNGELGFPPSAPMQAPPPGGQLAIAQIQAYKMSGSDYDAHGCAISTATGSPVLWCWGANTSGQLGINQTSISELPMMNLGPQGWSHVATGFNHTCAIRSGEMWCWGGNRTGQLGIGTAEPRLMPVQVEAQTDWTDVVAGHDYTCGLRSGGQLWCWGWNAYGQLGDGESVRTSPVPVQF